MSRWLRFVCVLSLFAGCTLLTGCGAAGRAPVSGKVTIEGKSPGVTGIIISFVGKDNQTVTAEVGADGSYQASGVQIGENKVCLNFNVMTAGQGAPVVPEGNLDPDKIRDMKRKSEEERLRGNALAKQNPVPPRYNDPTSSGLKFVAEKASNVYNADLKR